VIFKLEKGLKVEHNEIVLLKLALQMEGIL
jgi:hypothetical protein